MIITLAGDNHYLLNAELKKLTHDFIEQNSDLALERFDGEELDSKVLLDAVQAVPFLSDRRLVIVQDGANSRDLAENLEDILQLTADTTDLVFVEGHPDKRSTYYKTLKKKTDFRELSKLDRQALPRWLSHQAKELDGSLSESDARFLVERAGDNQVMLANELQKLIDYDPKITRQTIELLTEPSPHSTVFELLDAAFAGNAKKAVKIYEEQRKQRVEPLYILSMIAWQLHILAIIKAAGQRLPDEIARDAGINPFVARKSTDLAGTISLTALKSLIKQALELEIRLKSVTIDADEALQTLLMNIAQQ